MRTNKKVLVTKDKTGLSEILFALGRNPSAARKSPYEHHMGRESNTITRILTNTDHSFSEQPELDINNDDFESGQNSTIIIRERARGTKLEGNYKKRKGVLLKNSNQTITFLPAGRTQVSDIKKRNWVEQV